MEPPTNKEMAERLMAAMQQNIAQYRRVTRSGGIQRVEERVMLTCMPSPNQAIGVNEILDQIANDLGCTWSFNHKQRIFYFIPNEMLG